MRKIIILFLIIFTYILAGCNSNCSHLFSCYYANNDATCTEDGTKTALCDKGCGAKDTIVDIGSSGHTFGQWQVVVEATEDHEGKELRTCSRCSYQEEKTIDKLEHKHNYVKEVFEPTCTDYGFVRYSCDCGFGYDEPPVKPLGHLYGDWIIEVEPTLDSEGLEYRVCSRCNDREENILNPIVPHVHNYNKNEYNPTCIKSGFIKYECDCGDSYIIQTENPLGHAFGEWIIDTEPTLDSEGYKHRICSRCDLYDSTNIPNLTHVHSYFEIIILPTCEADGYTTFECGCGDSYQTNFINASGHNLSDWVVEKEATEDTEGIKYQICGNCSYVNRETIPVLEHVHNYQDSRVEPTCEIDGYIIHTCRCGDSYRTELEALGHSYLTFVQNPTCTSVGYTTYTCYCGDVYTSDYLPILEHFYEETIKKPTCNDEGYTNHVCKYCKDSYQSDYVPSTNEHEYEWSIIQEQWCNSQQISEGICKECGTACYEYGEYHEHIITEYVSDGDIHHRKCLCGGVNNIVDYHNFNLDYTCKDCQYKYEPNQYTTGLEFMMVEYEEQYQVVGIGDATNVINLKIPAYHNYRPVVSIAEYAFERNETINTVEISSTISWIDHYAFAECENLEKVTINENCFNNFYIGTFVFNLCPKLKTVYYYGSINNYGNYTMYSSPCANGANLYINDELVTDVDLGEFTSSGLDQNFAGVISLKSIILPNSSWINPAFTGCINLETIVYPDEMMITDIFGSCYEDCKKLKNVYIPDGVTTIHQFAFRGCESLEKVIIPNTVDSINPFAFENCKSLKEIEIPSSVTYLSWGAFRGCSSLKKVNLYANVTELITELFEDCVSLEEVNFAEDNQINKIGNEVFRNCTSLKSFNIPLNVTEIGDDSFIFSGLEKIELANNVETIGTQAFRECPNLKEIVLGSNVKLFESYAFLDCPKLDKVNYLGTVEEWASIEFEIFFGVSSNPLEYGANLYINDVLLTELNIDNIERINDYAFINCQTINFLNIGSNVKEIGRYAFYNCTHLYSVTLGENVTLIEDDAFYNCASLYDVYNLSNLNISISSSSHGSVALYAKAISYEIDDTKYLKTTDGFLFRMGEENILLGYYGSISDITLPDTFEYEIANYAFQNNKVIGKVVIPDNVTKIGKYAFADSTISEVKIAEGIETISEYAFYNCDNLKEFIMPDSVTTLYGWLLSECDQLEKVYIGSSCTTLYTYAFSGCMSLSTFEVSSDNPRIVAKNNCIIDYNQNRVLFGCKTSVIPEDVEIIGLLSFVNCYGLKSIDIPDNITTIQESAFYGCTALEEVNLSKNVNEIVKTAFAFCGNLKSIDLSNVNKIGNGAFYSCKSLDNINLSDNITSIGAEAFLDCNSLSSIYLGKNLTSISYKTFGLCSSLKEIIIPENVTTIGYQSFSTCEKLEKVTVLGDISYIGYSAFSFNSNLKEITFVGNIEGMDHSVFQSCISLEKLDFSHTNLKELRSRMFMGCSSLKEVLLPDTITLIRSSVFSGCSSLETIKLPKELITLEDYAFNECESLKLVEFNDKLESIGYACFFECISLKEVNLPNSVTKLGESCFSSCNKLEKINIPTNLVEIPNHCFVNTNIKYIEVPNHITKIGYDAFFAANLEEVRVLHDVELGYQAFAGCFYLTKVVLTNEITNIEGLFNGALNLEEIFYLGTQEEWNNLVEGIYDENEVIASAKVYFYSDVNPEQSDLYWYWDENNNPVIW